MSACCTLLIVAECSGQDLGEPVVGQTDELADETQRVEHAAIELVSGGDEVAEEDFENVALARFGRDQVVQLDVAGLADAVDATHPLFETYERPRDVPVHQDVRGLQVDAFVARVRRHEDLEVASGKRVPDGVPNGVEVAARVPACRESAGGESSDEPVGGVGVLREHDRLLAVARLDPVCAEAGEDERVPLRHREPGVGEERLETGEQTVDLLALLLRRPRRLDDDLRLVRLGRVVSVRVRLERRRRGHRASHPVPAALESLRERVQARRSSLAVDHAAEGDRVRREEPVDEVERLSVEVGLGRVERHGLVRRPPPLEELGDPVEVDEVLLHAAQEVHAARFRGVSGFLVGGDRRVDVGVDEVEESTEQPFLAAVRCGGHEQSARSVQREQFARLVVRRGSRREPVRLVEHDRVPARLGPDGSPPARRDSPPPDPGSRSTGRDRFRGRARGRSEP